VTAHQLTDFLQTLGIAAWAASPRDAAYRLPAKDWIFGDFAKAFESFKASLGANEYAADSNDCDDFTDLAVWYARFLHSRAKTADSIAFGSFIYERDSGGCHSICAAIVNDPEPALVFFEPQNSAQVTLTPTEIFSCQEARF
jgi:hypothetical protein